MQMKSKAIKIITLSLIFTLSLWTINANQCHAENEISRGAIIGIAIVFIVVVAVAMTADTAKGCLGQADITPGNDDIALIKYDNKSHASQNVKTPMNNIFDAYAKSNLNNCEVINYSIKF